MNVNRTFLEDISFITVLLTFVLGINACSSKQHTLLYQAVYKQDQAEASKLITLGYDPDVVINDDGWCPLIAAAYKDDPGMLDLLLSGGADPDAALKNGVTALHISAEKDDPALIELLLRHHADVNVLTQKGVTPLYTATAKNKIKTMKLLLDAGADVHGTTKEEWTPLLAAAYSNNKEAVELLQRHGAQFSVHAHAALNHLNPVQQTVRTVEDANQTSAQNLTILHFALKNGHMDMARFLIEMGARVNQAADENLYPIHLAASWNDTSIVDLLIQKGADIHVKQSNGLTPLHRAASGGHTAMMAFLLDKGADLNATTPTGESPLYSASVNNHPKAVRLLLERGASPEVSRGWTPLMVASSKGYINVIQNLLSVEDLRINYSHKGATALYLACYGGHRDSVELLINAGADHSRDYKGWTCLHGAARSGSLETVAFLLDNGVDVNSLITKTKQKPMDIAYDHLEDNTEMLTLLTGYYGEKRLVNARKSAERGDGKEALLILRDIQGYYDHHVQKNLRDIKRIQKRIKARQLRDKLLSNLNVSKNILDDNPETDEETDSENADVLSIAPQTAARLKRKMVYMNLYEHHRQRYQEMADCLEKTKQSIHCLMMETLK